MFGVEVEMNCPLRAGQKQTDSERIKRLSSSPGYRASPITLRRHSLLTDFCLPGPRLLKLQVVPDQVVKSPFKWETAPSACKVVVLGFSTGNNQVKSVTRIAGILTLAFAAWTTTETCAESLTGKDVEVVSESAQVKVGQKLVGVVRRGQMLVVVKEQGPWLGVHYTDATGDAQKGWIQSKHVALKKSETTVSTKPVEPPTKKTVEQPKTTAVKPVQTPKVSLEKVVMEFKEGSKEAQTRLYQHLEKTGELEKAAQQLSRTALPVATKYFGDLREMGREQFLADYYRDDFIERAGDRDKAFDEQLSYEKHSADYAAVWPEHFYLIQTGIVIGLKPKNRKIVELMSEAKPDEFGTPAWVKSGPIIILTPENGEWKIAALQRMGYAYNLTKMLRRQAEELK